MRLKYMPLLCFSLFSKLAVAQPHEDQWIQFPDCRDHYFITWNKGKKEWSDTVYHSRNRMTKEGEFYKLEKIRENFDTATLAWLPYTKDEIYYLDLPVNNPNARIFMSVHYFWNDSLQAYEYRKGRKITYSAKGNKLIDDNFNAKGDLGKPFSFDGPFRFEYRYGIDDRIDCTLYFARDFETGKMIVRDSTVNEYDENGFLLKSTSFEYNHTQKNCVMGSRNLFTNNDAGLVTVNELQKWDGKTWRNKRRTTSEYDQAGNKIKHETRNWSDKDWSQAYSVILYTYNEKKQITATTIRSFNENGGVISSMYQTPTYDSSTGRLIEYLNQKLENGVFENNWRSVYFPCEVNEVKVEQNGTFEMQAHFTANNTLHIQLSTSVSDSEITLIALDGKQFYSGTMQGNEATFALPSMPTGIYVISLKNEGDIFSQKIFKP